MMKKENSKPERPPSDRSAYCGIRGTLLWNLDWDRKMVLLSLLVKHSIMDDRGNPHSSGAAMKRVFLLASVLIVTLTWAMPARAQIGILSLASNSGIGSQLDNHKNPAKKKQTNSLPPPPVTASARAHSSQIFRPDPAVADRFGRVDNVGHKITGYPVIRGDVNSANAALVPRGGANGSGGKVIRHQSTTPPH
jgi:hypothetical protein